MEGKKTKEKTRVLAHSRRQKENDTFTDIAQSLPIQENAKDLDKASILRVAIHYLKLRDLVRDGEQQDQDIETATEEEGEPTATTTEQEDQGPSITSFLPNFSKDVLQALDGFLLIMSREGRILYASESITNYLGLRQVDVIGVHVQDIIHPQDCSEMAAVFRTQGHDVDQVFDTSNPLRRNFVVRMRCAFTPSVRAITRCSNFKPIYCSSYLKFAKSGPNQGQFLGIVALCKMASISRIREMCVGTNFKTKHSLDLSYMSIDTRIRWILGYDPSEMMGLKAYQYFHPEDLTATSSCHMNLLTNGQSYSPCYRFMSRWGDWVWVRSKSHMLFSPMSHLPEGIIIYTWIVRVEEEDDRMKAIQDGKSADHIKKYTSFATSVSSSEGTLDILKLADPNTPSTTGGAEPTPSQPEPVKQVPTSGTPSPTHTPLQPLGISSQPVKPVQQVSPLDSPPESALNECPPNVNPFATSSCANSPGQHSPEQQSVIQGSEVIDQSMYDTHPMQHSFMPSPPYTPYNSSPTKPVSFDNTKQTHNELITNCAYTPYPTPYASPQTYSRSLSPESSVDSQYGSPTKYSLVSPPYVAASLQIDDELDITSEATQFTSPSIETQATVFGFGDCTNLTELQFMDEGLLASQNTLPPMRQTVIDSSYVHQVRARYNRVANAVPGGYSKGSEHKTESISQWSQWLKGGAPAPVY